MPKTIYDENGNPHQVKTYDELDHPMAKDVGARVGWFIGKTVRFIIDFTPVAIKAWPLMIRLIKTTVLDLKAGQKFNGDNRLSHWIASIFVLGFLWCGYKTIQWHIYSHPIIGWVILAVIGLPLVLELLYIAIVNRDRPGNKPK